MRDRSTTKSEAARKTLVRLIFLLIRVCTQTRIEAMRAPARRVDERRLRSLADLRRKLSRAAGCVAGLGAPPFRRSPAPARREPYGTAVTISWSISSDVLLLLVASKNRPMVLLPAGSWALDCTLVHAVQLAVAGNASGWA